MGGGTEEQPPQARPSEVAFSVEAALPLVAVGVGGETLRVVLTVAATLVALACLGAAGARLGGAPLGQAAVRVPIWGSLAMALTSAIGALAGTAV